MQKTHVRAAATVVALATLAGLVLLPAAAVAEAQGPATGSRGEYIVHHVAMCVQCHSPRDREGNLVESKLLQGARVPVASPWRDMWALAAPQIAGLPGFTDEQVTTLLMTGHRPDGEAPLPPMPSFRMNRADAAAVVSYLRSLGAGRVPVPEDPAERPETRRRDGSAEGVEEPPAGEEEPPPGR
jgi:mono/diheme cytochrome c family protein